MRLLPLILAAALAATPALAAPAPTPGFAEALARAERYEKQFNDFRMGKFYAVVGPALAGIANRCSPEAKTVEREFKLVISYADGRFSTVETDNADPAAVCFQAALSELPYPAPPVPDFAEEVSMHLMPDGAKPPAAGAGPSPDKH